MMNSILFLYIVAVIITYIILLTVYHSQSTSFLKWWWDEKFKPEIIYYEGYSREEWSEEVAIQFEFLVGQMSQFESWQCLDVKCLNTVEEKVVACKSLLEAKRLDATYKSMFE